MIITENNFVPGHLKMICKGCNSGEAEKGFLFADFPGDGCDSTALLAIIGIKLGVD